MDKQPRASLSLDLSEEEVAHLLMKRSGGAAPARVVTPGTTQVIIEVGKHSLLDAELALIDAAMEFTGKRKGDVCKLLDISRPTLARKLTLIEKRKKGGAA